MNLIFDESGAAFFSFFKPLTTHISSLSCCLAINEEKKHVKIQNAVTHVIQFLPMKFLCKLGGVLFPRWISHVGAVEEALLLHNNHSDGFDQFTPALMQHAVISKYSSSMCKSLNGV